MTLKFESIGDKQNEALLVREILLKRIGSEVNDLSDAYGISQELIEEMTFSIFVNHTKKSLWKAGKTKFVKIFDNEAINLIDEDIIDFDDLGFLTYLASKYTNMEDNYLRKDGNYLTKKELIADMMTIKKYKNKSPESYLKKKIRELEKKNLILSEQHPTDRRNKVFYLSPYLFYRGKYIDDKAKKALLKITKTVHAEIKKLNEEGKVNIPLDAEFETKDDKRITSEIMELINEAS
jgi:hypothetical protein